MSNSSINASEVSKFEAVGSKWWEPNTASAPLLAMNPCRVGFIVDELNRVDGRLTPSSENSGESGTGRRRGEVGVPLQGLRILDVGCGGGILSEALARCGASVTGIDPSEGVIEAAKDHGSEDPVTRDIEYIGGVSIEDYADSINDDDNDNGNRKFDAVCILEVLEHTSAPQSLIDSASRLLLPGGLLFVSTINKTAKSAALAVVAAEHITRMIPVGTHDWRKFLSPGDVKEMGERAGLREVDVKGMIVTIDSLLCSKLDATKFRWRLDDSDLDCNWIGCYELP